jgi:hypothetical protein
MPLYDVEIALNLSEFQGHRAIAFFEVNPPSTPDNPDPDSFPTTRETADTLVLVIRGVQAADRSSASLKTAGLLARVIRSVHLVKGQEPPDPGAA